MSTDPDEKVKGRSTRRKLLKRGLALGLAGAAATTGYTFLVEPFWWQAVHLELPIAHLPPELVGCTLIQISDLHIGPRVDEEYISRAVQGIGAFDPDIIVITGDIVHYTDARDAEQAARVLAGLRTVDLPRSPSSGITTTDTDGVKPRRRRT